MKGKHQAGNKPACLPSPLPTSLQDGRQKQSEKTFSWERKSPVCHNLGGDGERKVASSHSGPVSLVLLPDTHNALARRVNFERAELDGKLMRPSHDSCTPLRAHSNKRRTFTHSQPPEIVPTGFHKQASPIIKPQGAGWESLGDYAEHCYQ